MTVAVTGASGQLGRLVAERLLDATSPSSVVLITRDPAKLADLAERGADVRAGDFADPASLETAFAGVDRLLLVSTDVVGPERVAGHVNAIEAAKAAGVPHVVYTSIPRPVDANPAVVVADHRATEEALAASGLAWTFLRNNLYAELQVGSVEQAAATGSHVTNTGTGGAACVARADCAAVAAGVLLGEGHDNQAYDVTGPTAVTASDIAALAGPEVDVMEVDDAAFSQRLQDAGLPAFVGDMMASFGASVREGYLAEVTDVVERIGGLAPTSFADVVAAARAGV